MNAYLTDEQVGTTRTAAVVVPTRQRDEQTVVRVIVLHEATASDGKVTYTSSDTPMVVDQFVDSLDNATWEDAAWY